MSDLPGDLVIAGYLNSSAVKSGMLARAATDGDSRKTRSTSRQPRRHANVQMTDPKLHTTYNTGRDHDIAKFKLLNILITKIIIVKKNKIEINSVYKISNAKLPREY